MPTQWLKNLSHKAAHVKMLQPIYGISLGKLDAPLEFQSTPADLFGGDAGRGRWIANGQIDINGHRAPLNQDNWFIGTEYQQTPFFEKLHSFDFLIETKSLGGDAGRHSARSITQNWLNHFQHYNHNIWTPDLCAARLVNWMIVYDFAFASADDDFLDQFNACFYKQYHHLKNIVVNHNHDIFEHYTALWALVVIQCHCDSFYDEIEFHSYLQLIKGVLHDISYNDGGLIDRNPQNLLQLSKSLLQLQQSLRQKSVAVPLWLSKKIEISTRTVNSLTHCDKDFPQFQGATLPNKKDIAKITQLSHARYRRNDTQLIDSGYTTMRKKRTSILVDHGLGDHTSPFAFEMGYGTHRIIVNCGTYYSDQKWAHSLRGIAAHSCLSINEENPKESLMNIKPSLDNLNGASLFSGTHEGYRSDYALTHTRRIYLDSEGEDIRGEDVLVRNLAIKPLHYTLRFHLHPTVKASIVENKTAVLLKLPSGVGWMFHVNDVGITLEESIYCGDGFDLRKSRQIVVSGLFEDLSDQIKWAIKRQ